MKFIVQKKGEKYLVSNDTTGVVRGVFKDKTEADAHAKHLQKEHKEGIEMASAKMVPKETEDNNDENGE